MDFIDKTKEVATNVLAASVKKGKELHATSKLKIEIAGKQKAVRDLYRQIGFDGYKAYIEGEDVLSVIEELFKKIDVIEEEIAELRRRVQEIKDSDGDFSPTYDEEYFTVNSSEPQAEEEDAEE